MRHHGFTLAELLIALAILGIIATFTIPKVLNSSRNQQYNSQAKEVAAMLSGAFQELTLAGNLTNATYARDFTPYFNYVSKITTGVLDNMGGSTGSIPCSWGCYKLHNGGVITASGNRYASTTTNTAVFFYFDPDGEYHATEESSSVLYFIYLNGRLVTRETLNSGTCNGGVCESTYGPITASDPEWFSWDR